MDPESSGPQIGSTRFSVQCERATITANSSQPAAVALGLTRIALNIPISNDELAAARALLTSGSADQAISAAQALVGRNPNDHRAWHLLSLSQAKSGRIEEAQTSIARAIDLAPTDVGLRLQQGQYLIANGQRRDALGVAYSLAQASLPRADWNDALGTLFALCDEPSHALPLFERAVSQAPSHTQYRYNLAAIQRMTGDLTGAEATLNEVIAAQPSNGYAYYTRSDLRTQTPARNNVRQMLNALETHIRHAGDQILLCYALGKELDDIGDYASAFSYFKRAADAQRRLFTYDVADDVAVIARIIERHTASKLVNTQGFECDECIFVLGLPRTGTTLVEQVLSAHSEIFGAGELQAFPLALVNAAKQRRDRTVPKLELVDRSLEIDPYALGHAYIEATRPQTGKTRRFIDKQPLNYLYAGLISQALPNARFIAVLRDPVDSCFAMYRTLFTGAYPFSYTLPELATYYLSWQRLIDHWRGTLGSRLLVVRYEDLVRDFESTARRMIEHCGVDWEDELLTFHRQKRAVTTASATQVRRPVYTSSVGKWRNYATQLRPLVEALGTLASTADRRTV